MNVINNTINRMNFLVLDVPERLSNYKEEQLSAKASPLKWSKKELLGHLCDSAVNNLGRFIRAQFEEEPFH
ncbi:MAG: DinB family protein, partial [Ignavibacteria bacterium]|nr:DinB family protein [Ignavibacteria bacterium]